MRRRNVRPAKHPPLSQHFRHLLIRSSQADNDCVFFLQNLYRGRCVLGFKLKSSVQLAVAEIRKNGSDRTRCTGSTETKVAGIFWKSENGCMQMDDERWLIKQSETPWRKNCSRGLKPEGNARNKKCAAEGERAESSRHIFRISHATPPHSTAGWHGWLRKPPAKDDFGRKPEMTRRESRTDQLTPFVTRQSLLRETKLAGIFDAHVCHFQFSLRWQIFRPTVSNVVKVVK